MEPEKLNFGMNRKDERNFGHTRDEWGRSNTFKCVTCGKKFEFIGSTFCSKRCYEDYFVAKAQKK